MIKVNIWFSTANVFGKRIKSAIGSFFAGTFDENAGHVNFTFTALEGSATFDKLEKNQEGFRVEKTMMLVGEKRTNLSVKGPTQGSLKFWQNRRERANILTYSFWPEQTPSAASAMQDLLHLAHLAPPSKGTKSEMHSHEEDMVCESTKRDITDINHRINLKKKGIISPLQQEKNKNMQIYYEAEKLEVALEEKMQCQEKIGKKKELVEELVKKKQTLTEQYSLQESELLLQQTLLEKQQREKLSNKKFITLALNYMANIRKPDDKTLQERTRLQAQLSSIDSEITEIGQKLTTLASTLERLGVTHGDAINDIDNQLQAAMTDINRYQNVLQECEKLIDGRTISKATGLRARYKQGVDLIQREEQYEYSNKKTQGVGAEYSVELPTKSSGLPYYLDDDLVLEAMSVEQKKNYSLILRNCAVSAKICLLAGLQPIKEDLIAKAGFKEKDFRIQKPETPKSMRTWLKKLEKGLDHLNKLEAQAKVQRESNPADNSFCI
ncbi:hypothetical protein [Legionella cardiaca]|uniref:Coiled-coil protein n=1 Tax=Legionella cardiaca TaxID=1071983 RepID=A0ABY8AV00_9GAMM|nr:hypothetical protein [Legionella cardiaca]WED43576.1 hypothetical protein PXX05_02020 [Legionella cardiaca]